MLNVDICFVEMKVKENQLQNYTYKRNRFVLIKSYKIKRAKLNVSVVYIMI